MGTPLEKLEGKYELLEKIREGGMGSVYKVRHKLLDEVRVIKVMRPQLAEDETLKARFLREAKMAIRLHHPNLAQIYDFTMDENGYAYLVMEFIDGLNLQEIIKVLGRPAPGLVLEVADQSLDAIAYLHRKRVIHRDISPDNILVARDEDGIPQIKLIDLGIAKEREGEDSLTSAGTFLGKVRYSSPEHFRTHEGAKVGARSDLYSFGVVLYELLTGTYPIKGGNIASLISGHLMHPPRDFDTSDPDGLIPEPLRAIVLKAMAKQPDDRFDSAKSFRQALAPHRAEHPVEQDQLRAIFEIPTITTRSIPTVKPGSTQSRIDQNFGLSTTPPPGDFSDPDIDIESSGTVETGGESRKPAGEPDDATVNQVRALLVGAGKLIEGRHYEEARLQLATVLEFSPNNAEAKALLKSAEEADVKLQDRRNRAAKAIRKLVDRYEFDRAEADLERAIETEGNAVVFDEMKSEIGKAKKARAQKLQQLEEMVDNADQLMEAENFEEAVGVLKQALEIDPGNRELQSRRDDADTRLRKQREKRRKEEEIADSASTIAGHIESGDADHAERALAVAVKLYGPRKEFDDLGVRLEELRGAQREEAAQKLRDTAAELIDDDEFSAAIDVLEAALRDGPASRATEDLLATARDGLRLQEEALLRQKTIDEIAAKIERLVLAGRLETAERVVEAAVEELGDFDEASELRRKIEKETDARTTMMQQIGDSIGQALECSADDRFAEAEEALSSARNTAAERPECAEMVAEAETEIRRRIDAHRRRVAIEKVVQSVERQLGKASPEEAQRELAVAKRLYGESDVFDDLASKIAAGERALRRQELDRLIERALDEERSIDDAIADLDSALALDPHDERARRVLVQIRAARQHSEDEQIEQRAAEQMIEIDQLIADGDSEKALSALDAVIRTHGEFRTARFLRGRLEALLSERA